jgi:hypothetical protein
MNVINFRRVKKTYFMIIQLIYFSIKFKPKAWILIIFMKSITKLSSIFRLYFSVVYFLFILNFENSRSLSASHSSSDYFNFHNISRLILWSKIISCFSHNFFSWLFMNRTNFQLILYYCSDEGISYITLRVISLFKMI